MKLKLMVVLGSAFVLAACSSGEKKADDTSSGASSAAVAPQDANAASSANSAEGAPPSAPGGVDASGTSGAHALDPKYQGLSRAVRSNNSSVVDEAAKILANDANDATALNALALYHMRRSHPGAAKLLLNRALEKNPNTAALYNNLGVILLGEGEQIGAIAEFKKALHADVSNRFALGNLGSIYARGGDCMRGEPLLESAYKADHMTTSIGLDYGVCLAKTKAFDKAEGVYQDILKREPNNVAAHLDYAILLIDDMNKPKDGLVLVNKLKFLETDRKDVVARVNALEKKAKLELK